MVVDHIHGDYVVCWEDSRRVSIPLERFPATPKEGEVYTKGQNGLMKKIGEQLEIAEYEIVMTHVIRRPKTTLESLENDPEFYIQTSSVSQTTKASRRTPLTKA